MIAMFVLHLKIPLSDIIRKGGFVQTILAHKN